MMSALRRARPALVAALFIIVVRPPAVAAQPAELAGLEPYIEQAMRDWEIPGLAIAVVQDDDVIYARGFGERRLGAGEPVDEHTLFAIASVTKAMTVATLGMLVDDGALAWDDRVIDHLPDFRLADPYVTRHLTVRDLVTHRTGVALHDDLWIAGPFDRAEILRRARYLPQVDGFRAAYGYNNIMYMVAGEVVAAAAGASWDDVLRARLLDPLGMVRSASREAELETRDNVATAHVRDEGRIRPMARRNYDTLGPAGSVWSSAWEIAQWLRLQLGGGAHDGHRLVEQATLDEMHASQVVMRIDSTTRRLFPTQAFSAYGLGWRIQDYHGHKVVQHTGAVNYTRTQVGMVPAAGIGVVIITNLSNSTLQTALMYRVFDALLGIPETDWSAEYLTLYERSAAAADRRAEELAASRVVGTAHSLPLDGYAGTYADSLFGDVRVDLENGRLVLRYSPDYVADLEHWHYDTFRATWRTAGFGRAFVTFSIDARGQAHNLQLEGFTTFAR